MDRNKSKKEEIEIPEEDIIGSKNMILKQNKNTNKRTIHGRDKSKIEYLLEEINRL